MLSLDTNEAGDTRSSNLHTISAAGGKYVPCTVTVVLPCSAPIRGEALRRVTGSTKENIAEGLLTRKPSMTNPTCTASALEAGAVTHSTVVLSMKVTLERASPNAQDNSAMSGIDTPRTSTASPPTILPREG